MANDPLKPSHPCQPRTPDIGVERVPHGTLPADRLQAVLRRLERGFYSSPEALEIVTRRVLADLSPSAPDAPPGR